MAFLLCLTLATPAQAQLDGPAPQTPDTESAAPPAPPPPKPEMLDREMAVLQALDKVTARVSTLEVPVGDHVAFGTLDITVRACRQPPPLEPPESAAFLEITEARADELPRQVFQGWMFASSPALSAMEHPVYDVWVLDCKNASATAPADSPPVK